MKALPFLIFLLALAGCATPPPTASSGSKHPAPSTPLASLGVRRNNALGFFTGYEARCEIRSIDGVAVDSDFELTPGNHTLTVALSHHGRDYAGDVDLVIPEAKRYELKARRKGDAFMLSILDIQADKVIATSIAPVNDHMKFLVFVVQR